MANDTSDVDEKPIGTKCQIRIRVEREYAVVVHQIFNEKHVLDKEIMTVNSPNLLEVFQKVIGSYPTVGANFKEPFEMQSPFQMLYHYWQELDVYRNECSSDLESMHLNVLFDMMERTMGPERKRCETFVKDGKIEYSRLWTIYRPGDILIRHERGHPWLMKCKMTAYEENHSQGKYMEVHGTYTDFDGKNVGEATIVTKIYQKQDFPSEHPAKITDLKIYPRQDFLDEDSEFEKRLRHRGEHFFSLNETCTRQYDGQADYAKQLPLDFYDPNMALWDMVWWPFAETGRVVIDRRTFQQDNELSGVVVKSSAEVDPTFCPPFCRFYLPHIKDIVWDKTCLELLVMKDDQKALLHALVSTHAFPESPRDQMKQKGKGLVILLHGSPGSGKTLTAECCAEITGKPLLDTSMAELNKENRPWFFERRLIEILQYAMIWKGLVVFNEADVFLEMRKDDVADAAQRNALVAIFLKHLEYFSGIVFLTTNRVGVFDNAMRSRIHLALGYSPPDQKMQEQLWERSLKRATQEKLDAEIQAAIPGFVRHMLNGREIANGINTALTLARFEGQVLQLKHIETVLNMANQAKREGSLLVRRGTILEGYVDEPEEI
ncbi:P-loop containing nucleoside triphosphate hydrolase protein [Dendryphion nanum]|uniref:P-loop containing nucleoside triphosphate hydrolase protein n=1 Tax=Dendryphion nanum TaxID=256645 RepID=A0A9P9DV22_9PLEO|nr:P-loop containing nucleoside triphosphate hydrolase protein [Dendryphion nanum]